MPEYGLFVDNDWYSTGESFDSLNPATDEPIGRFAVAAEADVDRAVASARRAFEGGGWAGLPAVERGRRLRRAADIIRARAEEFAVAETLDTGKPIFESRRIDVPQAAAALEYHASLAAALRGDAGPAGAAVVDYTLREPLGVVAALVPWCSPLVMAARKLAPALAAGNVVVLKPASWAPLTAVMLGEVFREAGLPDGAVNILTGPGRLTGRALARHRGIDRVDFAGSPRAAGEVLAAAGEGPRGCSLELGGKSAALVLADARVAEAAAGILFGAFAGQGEGCCAASRVLVDRRVHDELVEALVGGARAITLGEGMDEDTRMGPLISAEHRQRVLDYIAAGREEAGEPLVGGGQPAGLERGFFVEPTIFDGVPAGGRLDREEILGPVMAVRACEGVGELVAAAREAGRVPAVSLWTADAATGQRLAAEVRAATVWVNVHGYPFAQAPCGACGAGGLGRGIGGEGLGAYTEAKQVTVWVAPGGFRWY